MTGRIVHPGETPWSMTERVCVTTLRPDAGLWTPLWWWLCLGAALALLAGGMVSVAWLFYAGLGIWGIDWPVAWGFDILNYVWWIAIASGGTFISALFFLLRAPWRTSLNRLAESLTLCAALCAAIFPILHLGRPQFFYWLFPYPNTMGLWAQFRSPLVWDFFAILAYVLCSVLFWYFGLLPDLATLRERAQRRWQRVFYGVLALGFRGSARQWRHYQPVYGVMAALMAPLVVSVHSIVGMDFAGGAATGWHSTQFPPFFVFGAGLSGFAIVLLAVIPLRPALGLQPYITDWHIDVLGRLLLTASLCVAYAYVMDVFSTFYGPDQADRTMFAFRLHGLYAPVYWGTIMLNIVFPQLLWWRGVRMNQPVVWAISLGVLVGMWLERFQIIVSSLARTQLQSAWGQYTPTLWEWSLLAGTIGLFLTAFLLLVRFIPMLAMAEMRAVLEDRPLIIAAFATEATLNDAATTLWREGACVVETYTGTQPGDNGGGSILPVLMLGGGVAGGMGGFGMQVYATTISYPLDIGGRPNLSWPSYIPATFELAVLGAVLAGIIGYFVTVRLPRLYDPVDESASMRDVMKGAHVLVVRSGDRARARQMLSRYEVLGIEEIGP